MRVPFASVAFAFQNALRRLGVPPERAEVVGLLLAENQRDGIVSHGLNRFAALAADVRSRRVDPTASPEKTEGLGGLERWDGRGGLGPWNARVAMARAVELAREHGVGCVGLRNTNHWMRAGAYGLQAAEAGFIGLCWTNTIALMPAWGADRPGIGNNPLVVAVPRSNGPLLVDMAMSQYSRGKMEVLARQGGTLPFSGGFDADGALSSNPAAILQSGRLLPIGYWKGSALAVILDAAAALVSGGKATHQIGPAGGEAAVSQVFLAINLPALVSDANRDAVLDGIVRSLPHARYPGGGMLRTRAESLADGVLVDDAQYAALLAG